MAPYPHSVLHLVVSDAFAGVERYVADVAAETARRGLEVTVAGGDPGRMREALEGADVRLLPVTRLPQAVRTARRHPAAVIHAHMTAAEMAALPALLGRRIGFVTTRHFAAGRGSSPSARLAGRLVAWRADAEIAPSRFIAARAGASCLVLPSGVPEADVAPVRAKRVLVAQRLEAEKRSEDAIHIWTASGLAEQGWRLVVAGDGADRVRLQDLARALAPESVDFVGWVPLRSWLDEGGILLAPRPDEPFGLSVLEAMARGLPVVTPAAGGPLETIGPVDRRFLYPVDDLESGAERLHTLALNPQLANDYGLRLRAHQRAHLTVALHVDRLLDVYAEALRRRRGEEYVSRGLRR